MVINIQLRAFKHGTGQRYSTVTDKWRLTMYLEIVTSANFQQKHFHVSFFSSIQVEWFIVSGIDSDAISSYKEELLFL